MCYGQTLTRVTTLRSIDLNSVAEDEKKFVHTLSYTIYWTLDKKKGGNGSGQIKNSSGYVEFI